MELRSKPQFMTMSQNNSIKMLQMAEYFYTDFDIAKIESYYQESMEDIVRPNNRHLEITDEPLGSSGNRTPAQQKAAQELAEKYLVEAGNDAVAFTDGSAMPNPGPCGAGASIYWAGMSGECSNISIPVSMRSTSYHGELKAIEETIRLAAERNFTGRLHIFSDCQSALRTANADAIPTNFSTLSQSIKKHAGQIQGSIHLTWIAGHADIPGNETADALAKQAATKAITEETADEFGAISHSEAKARIKAKAISMWRNRWARQNNGRSLQQQLDPSRKLRQFHPRATETKIFRLILRHNNLEENRHKMYPEAQTTPACECKTGTGDVFHFINHCPLLATPREEMFNTIFAGFESLNVEPHLRVTDTLTLLGLNPSLPTDMQTIIAKSLGHFIRISNKSI